MTDHANELRRYARKIAHPAGDVPSVMLAAADEIERLAARLEAAESEALEQARLNGMGASREAALIAKLEAAERERDWHAERCEDAMNECDALRAKIEAMERQEPLITVLREPDYWSNGHFHKGTKPYISIKQLSKLKIGDNLYALPGAKGEKDV